jgi:large subunit ribosomal protein L17
MNKAKFGRKLSRGQGARKALFRSLIKALINHGSIVTTKAKAKAVQKQVEKLLNFAKKDTVAARRLIISRLGNDRSTAEKLFKFVSLKLKDKKGGYTRVVNLPRRKGDYAEIVRFELTEKLEENITIKNTTKKETKKKPKVNALSSLRNRIGKRTSDK